LGAYLLTDFADGDSVEALHLADEEAQVRMPPTADCADPVLIRFGASCSLVTRTVVSGGSRVTLTSLSKPDRL
jgi:hypothetical protein